jgi:SHAQKYF class myb-like DNA-binding protein
VAVAAHPPPLPSPTMPSTTTTGKQHQPPTRPSLHAKPPSSQQKQQQTQQPTIKPPQGKAIEAGNEHTGRWTKEEHGAFLLGLQMHGKEWKKVAARVKTRTVVQTRTHAQKYFQKLSKGEVSFFYDAIPSCWLFGWLRMLLSIVIKSFLIFVSLRAGEKATRILVRSCVLSGLCQRCLLVEQRFP